MNTPVKRTATVSILVRLEVPVEIPAGTNSLDRYAEQQAIDYARHALANRSDLYLSEVRKGDTKVNFVEGAVHLFTTPPLPVEFIPDNLDKALRVLGVSLPESEEEFNLQPERWIQRLINRVIRCESELTTTPQPVEPDSLEILEAALDVCRADDSINENAWNHGVMQMQSHFKACRAAMLHSNKTDINAGVGDE